MRFNRLTLFFFMTFTITWLCWLPMMILNEDIVILRIAGTFSPLISSIAIVLSTERKDGLIRLLRPNLQWRFPLRYYLFALFSTAAFSLVSIGIYTLLDREPLVFNDIKKIYLIIVVFMYVLFTSVLGEETGWRGFALPILQNRFGPLKASVILGLIWGMWHLPLFLIQGNFHSHIPFLLFLVQEIALSIVITWLYNSTAGSLLIVHIFHSASNTTVGVLPILPYPPRNDLLPLYLICSLLILFSLFLILTNRLDSSSNKKEIVTDEV